LIDLGNNVRRFGLWQDYINWQDAFRFPDRFLESRLSEDDDLEFEVEFEFPRHMEQLVDTTFLESFNMRDAYYECLDRGEKGKQAVDLSLKNHCQGIIRKTADFDEAVHLIDALQDHIEHRLKMYTKCIAKSTPNYFKYLMETYNRQLRQELRMALDDLED
jgi:hypothetical protein